MEECAVDHRLQLIPVLNERHVDDQLIGSGAVDQLESGLLSIIARSSPKHFSRDLLQRLRPLIDDHPQSNLSGGCGANGSDCDDDWDEITRDGAAFISSA